MPTRRHPSFPFNNQWSQFATALLCQAIYNLTNDVHSIINSGAVSNDLSTFNTTLSASGVLWYQTVFAQDFTACSTALAQVTDKAAALTEYQGMLTGSAWIQATKLQYQGGNAAGVPWEMFHHWIKLSILGMADSGINTLIGQIAQQSYRRSHGRSGAIGDLTSSGWRAEADLPGARVPPGAILEFRRQPPASRSRS